MSIPDQHKNRIFYICGDHFCDAIRLWRLVVPNFISGMHLCLIFLSAMILLTFSSSSTYANDKVLPGEEKVALFYVVTHLHPAIYVILFGVVILAVLNLSYQYRFSFLLSPGEFNTSTSNTMLSTAMPAGISAGQVPRVSALLLTPLDGINHSLPNFSKSICPHPQSKDHFESKTQ